MNQNLPPPHIFYFIERKYAMIENYVVALESLYILDDPAEMLASVDELLEQASALESFADEMDFDLAIECAMEASGEEVDTSASEISAKYRSGFNKIKKGKRTKNQKLVSEGQREVKEASDELKKAEKNADTPEKKKKLSTVAKIAIALGGAALLSLLVYVGVKNKGKVVEVIKKLKKNPGTNVAATVQEVSNAAQTAVTVPVEENPVEISNDDAAARALKSTIDSFEKGLKSDLEELSRTKQQAMSNIAKRHEELNKVLTNVGSTSAKSDSSDNSKEFDRIDSKLDKLLINSPSTPKVQTERQKKAEQIYTERARKKDLKDWKIARDVNTKFFTSRSLTKEEFDKLSKEEKDRVKHSGRFGESDYRYGSKDQYNTDRKKAGYYGFDSVFKYDRLFRSGYKFGPKATRTEEQENKWNNRVKLLKTWLKKDAEKLSGLSDSKIKDMDKDELSETLALANKVAELMDEYFKGSDQGWYDRIEPKLRDARKALQKADYKMND